MSQEGASSVEQLKTELAVISTKLDILIEQRNDHEGRIRSLEQFKWALAGLVIAGSGSTAAVVTKLLG